MNSLSKALPQHQAQHLVDFVNNSPSPFHAVDVCRSWLKNARFTELKEKQSWAGAIKPEGRYFFTRNGSSLVAFAVGKNFRPGNGLSIVAAHTDSPCFKLKPVSKKSSSGFLQVGVQVYGGGLWHTWFDRDLSVAGRVMVRDGNGGFANRLVSIRDPIMRIPSLAIHLDRSANEAFKFNKEVHLTPILATVTKAVNKEAVDTNKGASLAHHPVFLERIAQELEVEVSAIADFDLCLYDTQKATIGGICNEFIYSARLDNLNSSYCAIEGLINSLEADKATQQGIDDSHVRMVALFDNEEVGSTSAYGADSALIESAIRRIQAGSAVDCPSVAFEEAVANSFMISADVTHAVHPNYSEKHEENHRPELHKGPAIKINANQRYATTAVTSAILKDIASRSNIPMQEFVVRNDTPCGSTIGPLLSAKLGLRTIDIGNPLLGMHSIREVCGTDDVGLSVKLFERFFAEFAKLDAKVSVD